MVRSMRSASETAPDWMRRKRASSKFSMAFSFMVGEIAGSGDKRLNGITQATDGGFHRTAAHGDEFGIRAALGGKSRENTAHFVRWGSAGRRPCRDRLDRVEAIAHETRCEGERPAEFGRRRCIDDLDRHAMRIETGIQCV